jgi:hemolysin activation/secretion protein
LQVQAFYDHGQIQQSHNPDYVGGPQTNSATFKGAGLGVSWSQAGNFILRAVWAHRIGDNPLPNQINGRDGDGSYDLNRFWLTAIKFF